MSTIQDQPINDNMKSEISSSHNSTNDSNSAIGRLKQLANQFAAAAATLANDDEFQFSATARTITKQDNEFLKMNELTYGTKVLLKQPYNTEIIITKINKDSGHTEYTGITSTGTEMKVYPTDIAKQVKEQQWDENSRQYDDESNDDREEQDDKEEYTN